jgi:uncharacterized protein (DUF362 family)
LEDKGINELSQEMNFGLINFEDLAESDWVRFKPEGSHWPNGFSIAKPALEAEYPVFTCCLKTHQYGGVFTMALKLAVGLTPKDLMRELHGSGEMRKMIVELNTAVKPRLIILDGVEAFVDGGPMTGKKVKADVMVAGVDPIAVDSVGVAILKELGSNEAIMGKKIFEQEQIRRAVELGLGISGVQQIKLMAADKMSRLYAEKIQAILKEG